MDNRQAQCLQYLHQKRWLTVIQNWTATQTKLMRERSAGGQMGWAGKLS